MTSLRMRAVGTVIASAAVLSSVACTVDGQPVRADRAVGSDTGHVDTSKFDKLLAECEVLPASTIAQAVGGTTAKSNFFGANCRWTVEPGPIDVTFNWFEWGDYDLEKQTAKRLGFTTENIKVRSQSGFTQRDPKRPDVCGVTSKSQSGGIFTWWVEPSSPPQGDACAAPIKLMELILSGAN